MTYCLGIMTRHGLVMASDSRTNAGYDDVNLCCKMHRFVQPGERVFTLLCSGSLSLSQSVITLLERDFEQGKGLALAPTMYDAARVIGEQIRLVGTIDRPALERDGYRYNVHVILGGQVRGEAHRLYLTRVLQFSGAINHPSDDSGHVAPPPSLVAFPRLFLARSAAISC